MRPSTVFRSRWFALLWAAGIVWFALNVSGSQTGSADSAVNSDEANAAIAALNAF